jgi:carboxylesterase
MVQPLMPDCDPMTLDGGPHGALLLHGFTGCPQTMRPLARAFAEAGFAVELPLLPGHGTAVEDMFGTTWDDWTAAAAAAFGRLTAGCERVVIAGLSMGATLGLWLCTRYAHVAGLVCVNPLVRVPADVVGLVHDLLEGGETSIPAIAGDIADPEGHEQAYPQTPLEPLLSLAEGADHLRPKLGTISCPMLLMTSPQDHVVAPANSDELAEAVAIPLDRVSLDRSYHVATVDYDRDVICSRAVAFAQRVTASASPAEGTQGSPAV